MITPFPLRFFTYFSLCFSAFPFLRPTPTVTFSAAIAYRDTSASDCVPRKRVSLPRNKKKLQATFLFHLKQHYSPLARASGMNIFVLMHQRNRKACNSVIRHAIQNFYGSRIVVHYYMSRTKRFYSISAIIYSNVNATFFLIIFIQKHVYEPTVPAFLWFGKKKCLQPW